LFYNVSDSSGNQADEQTFTVQISAQTAQADTTPPVITLTGGTASMTVGGTYTAPTVFATDNADGDITSQVVITGTVNQNVAGTYTMTYNVTDSSGNKATKTHTVVVNSASTPNTPPTATNATADAVGGETVAYDLASHINDNETPDSGLTIVVVTGPTKGSLTWDTKTKTEFTFTATPGSGVYGTDSFTYRVQDSQGSMSGLATVTLSNISEDGNL